MHQVILILHVLIAIALIALVLLQQGKGADVGASFGSGASQTVFGSQGSTPFLVKFTSILAGLFFTTSLILGYLAAQQAKDHQTLMVTSAGQPIAPTQPANTETPASNKKGAA